MRLRMRMRLRLLLLLRIGRQRRVSLRESGQPGKTRKEPKTPDAKDARRVGLNLSCAESGGREFASLRALSLSRRDSHGTGRKRVEFAASSLELVKVARACGLLRQVGGFELGRKSSGQLESSRVRFGSVRFPLLSNRAEPSRAESDTRISPIWARQFAKAARTGRDCLLIAGPKKPAIEQSNNSVRPSRAKSSRAEPFDSHTNAARLSGRQIGD